MKLIEIINQFDAGVQQLETGGAFTDDKNYSSIAASGSDLQAYLSVSGSPMADLLKDKDVIAGLKDAAKALPDLVKKLRG